MSTSTTSGSTTEPPFATFSIASISSCWLADALLQQVGAAASSALKQAQGVRGLDVLAEHHDADRGVRFTEVRSDADSLLGAGWRHPNVGHDHVRLRGVNGCPELIAV